jgi:hypothetical protein
MAAKLSGVAALQKALALCILGLVEHLARRIAPGEEVRLLFILAHGHTLQWYLK